jgi:hypothetical protein
MNTSRMPMSRTSARMRARALRAIALLGAGAMLAGCGSLFHTDDPAQRKALADVVDAVQFAVDEAGKDKVWLATQTEAEHWGAACKKSKEEASLSCVAMADRAQGLCKALCPSGGCDPAAENRCQKYLKGEDVAGLCPATLGSTDSRQPWCTAARDCTGKTVLRAAICANADTIQLPELAKAELTVAVERSAGGSAGVNLLIVSFGGGRSEVSSNAITVGLKPRVRSQDYGSVPLPEITPKTVSSEARALATQLSTLIREAVAATVKEYEPATPGKAARPPMLMSNLDITFSLVVDSNGSLGIKKAWDAPAGIEFSAAKGTKRSNSLTITYARPE